MSEDTPLLRGTGSAAERRTLGWVLGINLAQAIVVGAVGFASDSTGLMGAALDNLADAGVYGVSLYAAGRTVVAKSRAARLSGVLLILVGLALLAEVVRRFVTGSEPVGPVMIVTAIANAAANLVCLRLLSSHRDSGVHLKASWIFTTNDTLANVGIVISGLAVMYFRSPLPDLVVGLIVVGIGLKGGGKYYVKRALLERLDPTPAATGQKVVGCCWVSTWPCIFAHFGRITQTGALAPYSTYRQVGVACPHK